MEPPEFGDLVKVRGIPDSQWTKTVHFVHVVEPLVDSGYFFYGMPDDAAQSNGVPIPHHMAGWGYHEADILLAVEPLPPEAVLLARKKLAAIERELESTHDG